MIDDKYGQVDLPGVPADEPGFIILARDAFAVGVLKVYYMFRSGVDDAECVRMRNTIEKFIRWPKRHVSGWEEKSGERKQK